MKYITALVILIATCLLGACGGGGGGCQQTGTVEFVYSPSVEAGGGTRLTYRVGQANQWTLTVKGVSSECLAGLHAVVRDANNPLPTGFTLNADTGAISTGVLTGDVEGYCGTSGGYNPSDVSHNRSCPSGMDFIAPRFVLMITTDKVNNTSQIPVAVTFEPMP